jgi:hypothetical protein
MMGGGVLGDGGLGDLMPRDMPEGFEDFGGPGAAGSSMREVMRPIPARPMGPSRPMRRGMGDDAPPEPIMIQSPPPRVAAPAILAGVTSALVTVGLVAGLYAVARRMEWV